jgi:hypothetical protein
VETEPDGSDGECEEVRADRVASERLGEEGAVELEARKAAAADDERVKWEEVEVVAEDWEGPGLEASPTRVPANGPTRGSLEGKGLGDDGSSEYGGRGWGPVSGG